MVRRDKDVWVKVLVSLKAGEQMMKRLCGGFRRATASCHDFEKTLSRTRSNGRSFFIVQSGAGYVLEIIGDTPGMTSDPVAATRFSYKQACGQITRLETLGFRGEMIRLRFGRIS